jgi:hypothetical protein
MDVGDVADMPGFVIGFGMARLAVLPTLSRTFRPIQKKNSIAEEKKSVPE